MTSKFETHSEIEQRLLVVSNALETATTSLESLVEQMRLALASANAITEATNKVIDENNAAKGQP